MATPDSRALFDAVVRFYGDSLYRFVRRMVGPTAADDVMQETILKIYQGLPRYRPVGSLRGYVFTIARNAARDHWKHESRRRTVAVKVEPEDTGAPSPADRADRSEQWKAVMRAVLRLPGEQREVFLLREEGDLSFKEIAQLTGAPLNTVLARMHYALKALRARLAASPAGGRR